MHALKYGLFVTVLFMLGCKEAEKNEVYNENNTNVINGVVYDIEDKPINGIYKTYYGNGSVKMEMTAQNGLPEGEGRFYDENGNLQFSGSFKNGKINGKFYQYYEDGNIHNELNYINGEQTGIQILYDDNAQKAAEVIFENNRAVSGYVIIENKQIPLEEEDLTDLSQNSLPDINERISEVSEITAKTEEQNSESD